MATSHKKDVRALLSIAGGQGFRVERRGGGHVMVFPPDRTRPAVVMSSTPSDSRAIKNARAMLRRAGLVG